MGLLSKLLGDEGSKQLGKLVKTVASEAEKAARQAGVDLEQVISGAQSGARPQQSAAPAPAPAEKGPSGFSWGDEMPPEENQYNFAGPYTAYFEMIFREPSAHHGLHPLAGGLQGPGGGGHDPGQRGEEAAEGLRQGRRPLRPLLPRPRRLVEHPGLRGLPHPGGAAVKGSRLTTEKKRKENALRLRRTRHGPF